MEALACSTVAVTITKDANVNNIFRRLVILNSRSRGAVIDTHDSELDTMTSQGEQFFRIK